MSFKTEFAGNYRTTRKKNHQSDNVLVAAYKRMRYIFTNFDTVSVSSSGGKDSACVVNIALDVARELGKLPLRVVFIDEEVISPYTHDYLLRLKNNPDIQLRWICEQVKQRNACSYEEPFWYTWDKTKQDVWVRPLPECAETNLPNWDPFIDRDSTGVEYLVNSLFSPKDGKVAVITGIRTEESLRRYRALVSTNTDNYIKSHGDGKNKNIFNCHPIYDWNSSDVWLAIKKFGWDYNRTYDIFNLTNLNGKYLSQRVCVPFGEEAMRGFAIYQECFPDMWAKMCKRVQGVGSAVRYANDALYGAAIKEPPNGLSWREYMVLSMGSYKQAEYEEVLKNINTAIASHYRKSLLPITESDPDPISGASWKFLCKCVLKGDFKGRWMQNSTNECGRSSYRKHDKTNTELLNQLIESYGTAQFKSAWRKKTARGTNLLDSSKPN